MHTDPFNMIVVKCNHKNKCQINTTSSIEMQFPCKWVFATGNLRLYSVIRFFQLIVSILLFRIDWTCKKQHFYYAYRIKLDCFSSALSFLHILHFSFLTSIMQRIGTCQLNQSGLWWNDGNESIDDWILNQWPGNDGEGFGTNKQRNKVNIEYSMITERIGMEANEVCKSNHGMLCNVDYQELQIEVTWWWWWRYWK